MKTDLLLNLKRAADFQVNQILSLSFAKDFLVDSSQTSRALLYAPSNMQ